MNPLPRLISHPIRFGTLTPEQEARIAKARDGRLAKPNRVQQVVDRYMPKPMPELYNLPDMNPQFAQDLVQEMDDRYNEGGLLGNLPEDVREAYREELAKLTKVLDEAMFKVPDTVIEAFERAYQVAFPAKKRWRDY